MSVSSGSPSAAVSSRSRPTSDNRRIIVGLIISSEGGGGPDYSIWATNNGISRNTITFTKEADAIGNGDVSWVNQPSETLAPGSWVDVVAQVSGDPTTTISYTFTPGSPDREFARPKVEQSP